MKISPRNNGRHLSGDTVFGSWSIQIDKQPTGELILIDAAGQKVGNGTFTFRSPERGPQPIPDDFDIETERRRTKQGGCCGQPSDAK